MSKVYLATIAYNQEDFVREALEHDSASIIPYSYDEWVVFDPSYPLNKDPRGIEILSEQYGREYVKIENKGCHKNFQQAFEYFKPNDDDIFIPLCPDARPSPGSIQAIVDVLRGDPRCFTAQLNRPGDYSVYPKQQHVVGGHEVLYFRDMIAWSFGGFRCDWVNKAGGFDFNDHWYGGVEAFLCQRLYPMGGRWYFIKNYYDYGKASPDELYQKWKLCTAGFGDTLTASSFEEWLKEQK